MVLPIQGFALWKGRYASSSRDYPGSVFEVGRRVLRVTERRGVGSSSKAVAVAKSR
jgi:hypothetical protein